jgi:hypothetical protein
MIKLIFQDYVDEACSLPSVHSPKTTLETSAVEVVVELERVYHLPDFYSRPFEVTSSLVSSVLFSTSSSLVSSVVLSTSSSLVSSVVLSTSSSLVSSVV